MTRLLFLAVIFAAIALLLARRRTPEVVTSRPWTAEWDGEVQWTA